ncbi:MAG: hypothetical protein KY442_04050, partial [Proteobacteria bacterium]|nr:hypothetical protein [Pseudomonadota bacterium]
DLTGGYWRRHARGAVRFADGMQALERLGVDVLVEIGPHPVLLGMGAECVADSQAARWLPSLRRGADDWEVCLRSLGELYVAGAELARALDSRLSSAGPAAGPVAVGLSFRAQDGDYCRTFVLERPQAVAGLACRQADGWRVTALGEATAVGGELRLASTALPPAILAEVDARLEGEPLDGAGERAARDAGWR